MEFLTVAISNNDLNGFKSREHKFFDCHCVKNVRIRSFSGPYFHAFGMNMTIYRVNI